MNLKKALHARVKIINEKNRLKENVSYELNKLKVELGDEILKTKSKIKTEKS